MPVFAFDIIGSGDRLPVTASIITDQGVIESACAFIPEGTYETGRTHIQVGVWKSSGALDYLVAVLIDDYVYTGHIPHWTGKFHLEEGEGLVAILRSADTPTVRVQGRILKRDP